MKPWVYCEAYTTDMDDWADDVRVKAALCFPNPCLRWMLVEAGHVRDLKSPGGAFVPLTRANEGREQRSIEPVGKVEWRIEKAMQKGKAPAFEASEALFQELKKPLAVKSPAFAIRGKCRGPMSRFPSRRDSRWSPGVLPRWPQQLTGWQGRESVEHESRM